MVLYAAKLKASAKPVSDLSSVEKKKRTKKEKVQETVEQVTEQLPSSPPPMDKKEAAKLKRKEKALLKKQQEDEELNRQQQEAQAALEQKETELKAAEDALKLKKETQKEKRRLKREAKTVKIDESVTESMPSTNSTEATLVEEKVKKPRKRKQATIEEQVDQAVEELPKADIEPPAWFKKYVAGVKNEESQYRSPKKAKRAIAKEANQVATEQWGNGFVRDRVRNEVDQHMSRMYQMIFNRGL